MPSQLIDSVILITSSDSTRRDFGTGFVIHQDKQATYVLTCAHVVRDVGGQENARIFGNCVEVIALGEDDGFDLAVLRVKGLLKKPKLSLSVSDEEGQSFILAGYSRQGKTILSRQISGKLGDQSLIVSDKREAETYAWDLKIEDGHRLQPGYSGSPVVDKTSGKVLGVAIQRLGEGETGLAISIEALEKIWQEMPSQLLRPSVEAVDNTQLQQPLGLKHEDVEEIEQPIFAQKEAEYQRQQEAQRRQQEQAKAEYQKQQQEVERQRQRQQSTPTTPSKPPTETNDLNSERGVDYTKLRNLLASGHWREADQETLAVMLKAANREKEGYLDSESIKKFPCTDLRTIDQLWVKYSNGRFGFSVQKRIWESVGGEPGKYDYEILKKFGDRVGWLKWERIWLGLKKAVFWLSYREITFHLNAPQGHLPKKVLDNGEVKGSGEAGVVCGWVLLWSGNQLFSRVETCKL